MDMQHAGVKVGTNGFQKDKSGEKEAETEEDQLEHRIDETNAIDSLFKGMNFYNQLEYVIGKIKSGIGIINYNRIFDISK
jgi:hypothetical protein